MEQDKSNKKNSIRNSSLKVGGNMHIGDIINIHLQKEFTPTERFSDETAFEIKEHIRKGKLEKAFDILLGHAKGIDDSIFNEVITIAKQWESLQRDTRLGVLSFDERIRASSRLTFSLLQSIDQLKHESD
ncbi:MAG: hypothetical protein MI974_14160 [Chitinophagales bacterium]|nr:hypothetical protein [Chitinophagales bacterium]